MPEGSIWDDLGKESLAVHGFLRLRVCGGKDWGLFAARRQPDGRLTLLLEVPTSAIKGVEKLASSRGLDVHVETTAPGPGGRVQVVTILGEVEFRDVFVTLANMIIKEVRVCDSAKEAFGQLSRQIARWQRFLEMFGTRGLSDDQQVGLYGELVTLRGLARIAGNAAAVHSWRGPARADQDFELPGLAIEVKSTRGGPPHLLRVSNVKQLDPPSGVRVFVVHIELDRRQGQVTTLPALVESMRAELETTTHARNEFEAKLFHAGYLDEQAHLYSGIEYTERRRTTYDVREGFPRIRRFDLPEGVGKVRYEVQLGACRDFEIPRTEMETAISEGNTND